MIRKSLADASLVSILPGKYTLDNTTETQLDVLLEAGGLTSLASHKNAAFLHGFDGFTTEPRPEITVIYGSTFHHTGVHRTRKLDPLDVVATGSRRGSDWQSTNHGESSNAQ